jgi:hypothetical protein
LFATGAVDTGGNLSPASLTPLANLPPVSLTPVSTTLAKLVAKFAASVVYTGGKFATGAVGQWCTLTCKYLREFSKKISLVLMGYSAAGEKLIHEKKPEAKNLVTLSL